MITQESWPRTEERENYRCSREIGRNFGGVHNGGSYIGGKWWTQGRVGCRGCARLRRSIFHFNLGNLRPPLLIPSPRTSCQPLVSHPFVFCRFHRDLAYLRLAILHPVLFSLVSPAFLPLAPCLPRFRLIRSLYRPLLAFFASSPDDFVIAQSQIVLACEMSCIMITDRYDDGGGSFKIASWSLVEQKWNIRGDLNCLSYSRRKLSFTCRASKLEIRKHLANSKWLGRVEFPLRDKHVDP